MPYNIEWTNENSLRKYPFKAVCNLFDRNRAFQLPNTFIIDAQLMMSIDFQFEFFLRKVTYSPDILVLEFSMATGRPALTGTIQNPDLEATDLVVNLEGQDTYKGSTGKVVIGTLEDMVFGEYEFFPADTILEPCKVSKLNRGVSAINGITDGNVVIQEGANIVITVTGNRLRIDTFDGRCACNECTCLKSLNSVTPDENGNIDLFGTGCMRVVSALNGLEVQNTCEDACCGCEEIDTIVTRANELQTRIEILEGQA